MKSIIFVLLLIGVSGCAAHKPPKSCPYTPDVQCAGGAEPTLIMRGRDSTLVAYYECPATNR